MIKLLKVATFHPRIIGTFALLLLLIFSLQLRQNDFNSVVGAQNLEATYHVLLTITALNKSPAQNHWFLPTVSLGNEADKFIPWGAAIPTKSGDYIYTSFTPTGFLAPYLYFTIFNLEPSKNELALFNFAIGALSAIVLYFFLLNFLQFAQFRPWVASGGALLGCLIGIFSREALLSHGIIYWSQSLYQLILILSLFLIFKWTIAKNEKTLKFYSILIVLLAFFGALTEWSGYIFNAGLVLISYLCKNNLPCSKQLAIHVFFATAIAGILTIVHYGLAVGFNETFAAFLGRFLARSASKGDLFSLLRGYILSYGIFIAIVFCSFCLLCCNVGKTEYKIDIRNHKILFIFVTSCIPLVENIILLQHATEFSFDRLKFIFPAALVIAYSFATVNYKRKFLLIFLMLLSGLQNYYSYTADIGSYSSWKAFDLANKKLLYAISQEVDIGCAVIFSDLGVRGYSNLLFQRGIYEHVNYDQIPDFLNNRASCASVYLKGKWAFTDLPKYSEAVITRVDGSTTTITNDFED